MNIGGLNNVRAPQLVRGINTGAKVEETATRLAEDSATVTSVLDGSVKTQMAQDLQALKTGLWARGVASGQLQTSLLTAGALLSGPQGVEVGALAGQLHSVVGNPQRMDELTDRVQHFTDRQPGDPANADGVLLGLNNQVTQALVEQGVGSKNVPVALFMGGALLGAEQSRE